MTLFPSTLEQQTVSQLHKNKTKQKNLQSEPAAIYDRIDGIFAFYYTQLSNKVATEDTEM